MPPERFVPLPRSWRAQAFTTPGSVLLESASPQEPESRSLLLTHPVELLRADRGDELPELFRRVEAALARGMYVAGWFAYECGAHFQQLPARPTAGPLAMLGVFAAPEVFRHEAAEVNPSAQETNTIAPQPIALLPCVTPAEYSQAIAQIQEWIAAGDTYQVNFTVPARSRFQGDAASLYEALIDQQRCAYAAAVRLDSARTILSLSPELFFRVDRNGHITARPMKGTAQRGLNQEEDRRLAAQLRSDEKTLAEHVMIVDLLRNDLGRICRTGSVQVPQLFNVEPYPTVLQMTSTITGELRDSLPWYEIFAALFPCGSVTGAPKHRTMQLIERVEPEPRGVYTGAIGYFAPDRSACFSVAIRTLALESAMVTAGVGSGIVADSVAQQEYEECLWKLAFVRRASEPLTLFETMRFEHGRYPLLERHLDRISASAQALGFPLDRTRARTAVAKLPESPHPLRVRLTLAASGELAVESTPLEEWPAALHLTIAATHVHSDDPALRHKCSFRSLYDDGLKQARLQGFDEMLFTNERGELTEGCISSLLVCLDGEVYTPPFACGLLPGVARAALLRSGAVRERVLRLHDLLDADAIYLCNAVRGIAPVVSLTVEGVRHERPRGSFRPPLW